MNREYFTPCALKMSKGIVFALQAAMMQEEVERIEILLYNLQMMCLPAWNFCLWSFTKNPANFPRIPMCPIQLYIKYIVFFILYKYIYIINIFLNVYINISI